MLESHRLWMVLLIVLFAGCTVGSGGSPENTAPGVEPVHVTNETTITYLTEESNLEEGENPHTVRIENNGKRVTTVHLYIVNEDSGKQVFEQAYSIEPNATVEGVLDYEANYTVTVERNSTDEEVTLSRSTFDCNRSGTTFNVTEGGITGTTVSTLAYCPRDPPGDR